MSVDNKGNNKTNNNKDIDDYISDGELDIELPIIIRASEPIPDGTKIPVIKEKKGEPEDKKAPEANKLKQIKKEKECIYEINGIIISNT